MRHIFLLQINAIAVNAVLKYVRKIALTFPATPQKYSKNIAYIVEIVKKSVPCRRLKGELYDTDGKTSFSNTLSDKRK